MIGWFWVSTGRVDIFPFCCYCSVRCSLVSPCLEGWLGDGAWEGCVPEGKVWAMGTPPGTMPSNAPGMPPGATPTTPGGYLGRWRGQRLVFVQGGVLTALTAHIPNTVKQRILWHLVTLLLFSATGTFSGNSFNLLLNKSFWWFQKDWGWFFFVLFYKHRKNHNNEAGFLNVTLESKNIWSDKNKISEDETFDWHVWHKKKSFNLE